MKRNILCIICLCICIYATTNYCKSTQKCNIYDFVELKLIDSTTTATVYNTTVNQCNSNPSKPANSRFTIDLSNPGAHRILAMERTMRKKYGLQYGDLLYIEGTDYDGYWQLQDCMNKRFKGKSRIDLLVDNSIRYGKWKNVRVYKVECTDYIKDKIKTEYMLSSL